MKVWQGQLEITRWRGWIMAAKRPAAGFEISG
jgi:hypothetical protein